MSDYEDYGQQGDESEHLSDNPRIRAGSYNATCTGHVEIGPSGENGTPTIAIGLKLETGDEVTAFLYFSENAKPFSIPKLKACGWNGEEDEDAIREAIKGHAVRVGIKYEPYQGKSKMKVNIYDNSGGFKFENEMPAEQKKSFLSQLKAEAMQGAPPAPKGDSGKGKGYPDDWDKPSKAKPSPNGKQAKGGFSLGGQK